MRYRIKYTVALIVVVVTLTLLFNTALTYSNIETLVPHAYEALVTVLPISSSGMGPHVPHLRVYLINYTASTGSIGPYRVVVNCVYPPPRNGVRLRLLNSSRRIVVESACWISVPVVWFGNATVRIWGSGNVTHVTVRMRLRLAVLNISKDGRPTIEINGVNKTVIVRPALTPEILRPNLTYVAVINNRFLPPKVYINGTYVGSITPFYVPWPRNEKDLEEYVMNSWRLSYTYMGAKLKVGVDKQGFIEIYAPFNYGYLENSIASNTLFYRFNYLTPSINGTPIQDYGDSCDKACLRELLRLLTTNRIMSLTQSVLIAGGAEITHYLSTSMVMQSLGFPLFIYGAPLPVTSNALGHGIRRIVVFSADFNYSLSFYNTLASSKVKMPAVYPLNMLVIWAIALAASAAAAVTAVLVLRRRKGAS